MYPCSVDVRARSWSVHISDVYVMCRDAGEADDKSHTAAGGMNAGKKQKAAE